MSIKERNNGRSDPAIFFAMISIVSINITEISESERHAGMRWVSCK